MSESVFPLNIADKEDHPDKTALLEGILSKYFETAAEVNKKTRALEELFLKYNSLTGGFQNSISSAETPLNNGLYAPTDAATYTNFGNLEYDPATPVAEGGDQGVLVFFIKKDAEYSKISIDLNIESESTPTESSTKLFESGGAFSALALKTNIADIVDNLTSTLANVPLSANQGKILKVAIDEINLLLTVDDAALDTAQERITAIKQLLSEVDTLEPGDIAGLEDALASKFNAADVAGLGSTNIDDENQNLFARMSVVKAEQQARIAKNELNLFKGFSESYIHFENDEYVEDKEDSIVFDSTTTTQSYSFYVPNLEAHINNEKSKVGFNISSVGGDLTFVVYPRLNGTNLGAFILNKFGTIEETFLMDINAYPEITDFKILVQSKNGAILTLNDIYVGKGSWSEQTKYYNYNFLKSIKEIPVKNYSSLYDLEKLEKFNLIKDETQKPIVGEIKGVASGINYFGEVLTNVNLWKRGSFFLSAMIKQDVHDGLRLRIFYYDEANNALRQDNFYILTKNIWKELNNEITPPPNTVRIILNLNNQSGLIDKSIFFKNFILSDSYVNQNSKIEEMIIKLSDLENDLPTNLVENYDNSIGLGLGVVNSNLTRVGNTIKCISGDILPINVPVTSDDWGKTIYCAFPKLEYVQGTSASKFLIYRIIGTIGGSTVNLFESQKVFQASQIIPNNTTSVNFGFKVLGGGSITIKDMYCGFEPYNENVIPLLKNNKDKMMFGNILNHFPDKNLNSYTNTGSGLKEVLIDNNGEKVLEINAVTGEEQRVAWTFDKEFMFNDGNRLVFNLAVKSTVAQSIGIRTSTYLANGSLENVIVSTFLTKVNEWDEILVYNNIISDESKRFVEITFNQATGEKLSLKRPILTDRFVRQSIGELSYDTSTGAGLITKDTVRDVVQDAVEGVVAVGSYLFKNNTSLIADERSYDLMNYNIAPTNSKLYNLQFTDVGDWHLLLVDSDEVFWFCDDVNGTKKITKENFKNALTPTADVNGEKRFTFDDTQLIDVTNVNYRVLRETGNGELIGRTVGAQMFYSTKNRTIFTQSTAEGTNGSMIDGWAFFVYDNIVVVSGYSNPASGVGKLIYSKDFGANFTTILDLETQTFLGTSTAGAHIHGCTYDKYWNRIWAVLGDYDLSGTATGKIVYCDNFNDVNPTWNLSNYNLDNLVNREQYCTVYAMKDCILFGTDMNPSSITRMNRVAKDNLTKRETVLNFSAELSHIPGAYNQTDADMPHMIYVAKAGTVLADPGNSSIVVATFDGVNFYEVWRDTIAHGSFANNNAKAYAFKSGDTIIRQHDSRFTGGNTVILSKMLKWK